jgi:hypothetical protein
MCAIDGCEGKAVAKGLCAKHYARLRRNGDPAEVRKAGRPRSELGEGFELAFAFPEWSPRTRARYKRALHLIAHTPQGDEITESAIKVERCAVRPNGTLNVSKVLRMATTGYLMSLSRDELKRIADNFGDEPSKK